MCVSAGALILVALLFRIYGLDHLPGLYGDEAWYANQAHAMISGEPYETRTPMGVILNPFYSGPNALLHLLLPRAIWSVRVVALLSGLGFLVASLLVFRRLLGAQVGLQVTLLAALLPFTVAYARFGWDSSQTPLATLLLLYFSWRRQLVASAIALAAALVVHPTNIFLLPVVLSPALVVSRRGEAALRYRPSTLVLIALAVALGASAIIYIASPVTLEDMAALALGRFAAPWELALFLFEYVRLLTGSTVLEWICGTGYSWPRLLADLVAAGAMVCALVFLVRHLRQRRALEELSFLASLGVALLGFYLLGGLESIRPGYERYAAFLISPSLLSAGLLLRALGSTQPGGRLVTPGVHALCWLLAGSTALGYFGVMLRTGGEASAQFRTAEVDPKEQALELILADAGTGIPVTVYPSDWWCGQPLIYLAHRNRNVDVRFSVIEEAPLSPQADARAAVYAVAFVGDSYDLRLGMAHAHRDRPRWIISDAGGRPFIRVYRLRSPGGG